MSPPEIPGFYFDTERNRYFAYTTAVREDYNANEEISFSTTGERTEKSKRSSQRYDKSSIKKQKLIKEVLAKEENAKPPTACDPESVNGIFNFFHSDNLVFRTPTFQRHEVLKRLQCHALRSFKRVGVWKLVDASEDFLMVDYIRETDEICLFFRDNMYSQERALEWFKSFRLKAEDMSLSDLQDSGDWLTYGSRENYRDETPVSFVRRVDSFEPKADGDEPTWRGTYFLAYFERILTEPQIFHVGTCISASIPGLVCFNGVDAHASSDWIAATTDRGFRVAYAKRYVDGDEYTWYDARFKKDNYITTLKCAPQKKDEGPEDHPGLILAGSRDGCLFAFRGSNDLNHPRKRYQFPSKSTVTSIKFVKQRSTSGSKYPYFLATTIKNELMLFDPSIPEPRFTYKGFNNNDQSLRKTAANDNIEILNHGYFAIKDQLLKTVKFYDFEKSEPIAQIGENVLQFGSLPNGEFNDLFIVNEDLVIELWSFEEGKGKKYNSECFHYP